MQPKLSAPESGVGQNSGHASRIFITYVMSDVYALLDYLSGRATPSLGLLTHRRDPYVSCRNWTAAESRQQAVGTDDKDTKTLRPSPQDPPGLMQHAMRIGQLLDQPDSTISEADAAALIKARDDLNVIAAPATGSSITFTYFVIEQIYLLRTGVRHVNDRPGFIYRDGRLETSALALAKNVRNWLWTMFGLLFVTVVLSAYVAYGKLLSDTRDAVNRDHGANLLYLAAEMAEIPKAVTPAQALVDQFCADQASSFLKYQNCRQYQELKQRKRNIQGLLSGWLIWPRPPLALATDDATAINGDETTEQIVAARIGVIGNYLLPILYGTIGSLGFVLRQFNRRLADRLLTPRESRASHIRLMLGAVSGACIGLFFNNSAGAAQATGISGAAVTLSASAIAFLAGYGVEALFKTLDALLTHVFSLNQGSKDHAHRGDTGTLDVR